MISRGSSPSISVGLVQIPFASHSGTTGPKRAARPVQAGLYEDDDQTDVNSEYSRRDRSHRLEQEMRLVYHGFPCFFQWAFSMVCHGSEDSHVFLLCRLQQIHQNVVTKESLRGWVKWGSFGACLMDWLFFHSWMVASDARRMYCHIIIYILSEAIQRIISDIVMPCYASDIVSHCMRFQFTCCAFACALHFNT